MKIRWMENRRWSKGCICICFEDNSGYIDNKESDFDANVEGGLGDNNLNSLSGNDKLTYNDK